jgi:cytochrome b6-f complex iron-sulfur subunit
VLPVRPNGSGKPVMIVRGEGDQFSAYSLKCSHLGCTVGWNGEARTFDCPCHGSRYQADGSVLRGPAKRPLTSYAVQADGTTVRFRVG